MLQAKQDALASIQFQQQQHSQEPAGMVEQLQRQLSGADQRFEAVQVCPAHKGHRHLPPSVIRPLGLSCSTRRSHLSPQTYVPSQHHTQFPWKLGLLSHTTAAQQKLVRIHSADLLLESSQVPIGAREAGSGWSGLNCRPAEVVQHGPVV